MSSRLHGLIHLPRAETILIRTQEGIDEVFKTFDIYLDGDIYIYVLRGTKLKPNHLINNYHGKMGYGTLLVRAEFDIYPLSDKQIANWTEVLRAKVDSK